MMQRVILACFAIVTTAAMPLVALAQEADGEPVDARLQGYSEAVVAPGNSVVAWLIFLVLAVVCLGVLFKDAQRTHLD